MTIPKEHPGPSPSSLGGGHRLRLTGGAVAALSSVLLIVTALLLNLNLLRLREARGLVRLTNEIMRTSAEVRTQVIKAETGQRGFLLTAEGRYLAPYEEAAARIGSDHARLVALVLDPEQKRRAVALGALLDAKLNELRQTLALYRLDRDGALALVRTDEGQRLSEEIRALLDEFDNAERQLLEERTDVQDDRAEALTILAGTTGMLSLMSALLGVGLIRKQRQEEQLREVNAGLERRVTERTASLAEANQELDAFAHTVSHDLRAPLRAMRGYAAALEEDFGEAIGKEGRQYVGRIRAAAERMDSLVEDILTYSRLAREDIRTGRVELEGAVDAVLEAMAPAVAETGALVEVRRPMPAVRAQGAMVRQALQNLIGNALKFTPPGKAPVVRVRAETRGEGSPVRLWVEDEGIGVAATHQERIFAPFERLHGRESYPGTGIGLAIVSRVTERLGGACGVFSRPDGGSRFWMDLPAWKD
ncbi:sensor histidine kinase [Sabulicella rubraurantiaca]|uniref:sensor histidine kinase n=1 Tax=Sabulicella rubraurantiaca TaxID=2811429 RepID=UPI001A960A27|nr:sensor histidine kinase [Sabulicella rubraurantiaca]